MGFENPNMRHIEYEAEPKGNFRYNLGDLYLAIDQMPHETSDEIETRGMVEAMCDDLRKQSIEYLGYVARFMEGTQNHDVDFARRLSHNAIISNLQIITRTLGGDAEAWFNDSAMHGGLGGETDRRRIKNWALTEALKILNVQRELEEQEGYGTDESARGAAFAA